MALVYVKADDKAIKRNRKGRALVFIGSAILAPALSAALGGELTDIFLDFPSVTAIGTVLGGLGGWMVFLKNKHRFFVKNDTTGALVTLNTFRSLFGQGNVDVIYGPGTHLSYPWETRFEQNNIPILEATEDFKFPVMCKDGILMGEGSFRLRPDFEHPVEFLSGVASVAGDLKDLIIAEAAAHYKDKSVKQATSSLPDLNVLLESKFVQGQARSPLEGRFGVQVGDVTIRTVLPSDELQRTLSAIAEAEMLLEGTAKLLGVDKTELKNLDQNLFERARREFRIMSGNMDGSQVNRWEVDVSGISPEIAQAVSAIVSRMPPEVLKSFAAGDKKPPARSTPKGGGRK